MKSLFSCAVSATIMLWATQSVAQDQFAEVKINVTPLNGSAFMLQGAGGNIGVSAGDDGVLIIDDQFAPLAPKISAALGKLATETPSYVINTHYHGDHTGSNAFFHDTKGATIFAHENVRIRLANDDSIDKAALPVVTFEDGIKIHFNGETLKVFHLANGHTDGDSVVWFEQANVLHTGDLFFNERFPYIDLGAGGTVDGYIKAVETLLTKIDDKTKIIPGHGPLANKADYENFLAMIKATKTWVGKQKAAALTVEQAIEKGLPEQYAKWNWNFITEEKWIKTLYQ
ncbi:MBL fold metallo-hydrolase [Alteromonas lipolytica]|uniref:MBL fold metallo-hydrolase n=1 Tax=Alteromonas lipolytica TaxID=1856405 RepID=A0A1E8FJX9_9ALTE|nr:MBL fold metallo-hydrolase [Alteromonas lipolytica]OFI36232.1 MBL fold metallo-hydrolase [Alteromonas lipolytica]GGF78988.1 cyclase [Alteromonas lipolytica]